jgi:hypothetical protein
MNLLRPLHGLFAALLYLCAATTVAESVGMGMLWNQGMLTRDKIANYAAVLYGFDLHDLQRPEADPDSDPENAGADHLMQRVRQHPLVRDRLAAVTSETGSIHDRTNNLRISRERFETVKDSFQDLLSQLETEASESSLQELQRTLEVLQPKQSKDLLLRILSDSPATAEESVLGDVVAIVQAMPQDKLRKIFSEFKTEQERETLHRILLEIGDVNENRSEEEES